MSNNLSESLDHFDRTFDLIVITGQLAICVFGVIIYAITCWIMIKYRKTTFANPFYTLAIALAVPDCLHLLTEILCACPASFIGYDRFSYLYMAISGFFADVAYWSMAPMVVVIAVNRYIAVCHFQHYRGLFSNVRLVILIGCCWGLGLFVPSLMYGCTCIYLFKDHAWKFYCDGGCAELALTTNMILANILTLLVVVVYALIFFQYKLIQRRMGAAMQQQQRNDQDNRQNRKEIALMFQFCLISFVLVFYVGTFWLVSLFFQNKYGDMFLNLCVNLNSCVSPMLYLSFSSEIRQRLPCKTGTVQTPVSQLTLTVTATATTGSAQASPITDARI